MLRKVITTGVAGLGISAVAMVPSAVPEENPLQLLQQQISRLTEAIQRRMATDEERFKRIEEDIRQLKQRQDNATVVQPGSVQPGSVQPGSVQPGSVQPGSVQHSSVQHSSVHNSSVQHGSLQHSSVQHSSVRPPGHPYYYPRYVRCRPPGCDPWW